MKQPRAEARRWLVQAESDLAFAEVGLREGFFPAEVFTRRQAEEAVAIARRIVAFARAAIGQ